MIITMEVFNMQIMWDYGTKKVCGITEIFKVETLTMNFVNSLDYKKIINNAFGKVEKKED